MKNTLLVLLVSAALPCTAAVEPMFRGGPAHTGVAASDAPLIEIAAAAGFYDQSHFSRTFKRLTGLTPAEYRVMSRPS